MSREIEGEGLQTGAQQPVPTDAAYWERLVDRYGIMAVCDYPQLLFGSVYLPKPGYRERNRSMTLSGGRDRQPDHEGYSSLLGQLETTLESPNPAHDPLARLRSAYNVLEDIFGPRATDPASVSLPDQGSGNATGRYRPG